MNTLSKKQENLINTVLQLANTLKTEFALKNNKMKVNGYTVTKRGNKYYTRIRVNGKQKFLSANTIKELSQIIKASLKEKNNKSEAKINLKTFGEWWQEYLQLYKLGQIKPSTLKSYKSVYNCYLIKFKDLELNKISIYECDAIIKSIASSRQKQKVFDMLKECLQKAVNLELIKKNPCKLLPRPKHEKTRINALTNQERLNFIEAMQNDKCKDYFMFLLLTGVRRGEGLAVTRGDVDFNKMQIKINKTISSGNVGTTKTKCSNRVIPILKQLYDEVLVKYIDFKENERLFPFSNSIIEKHFYSICKKANIKNISLHSFRHTFATLCFEIGIPILQIKEWLGHKDILTTQQIYIHLMETTNKKYLDLANNFNFLATQNATQNSMK